MPDLIPVPAHVIDDLVLAALEEDGADDDVTTRAVIAPGIWGRGVFVAKDIGVIAGLDIAEAAMMALSDEVSFDALVSDGERVSAGTELAEVEGPLSAILSAERVALNFLQQLSGVATTTRKFVDSVVGTKAKVLDTRKTTPGLRLLQRYAVRCGGGWNHRFNLAAGVLIKDNHLSATCGEGAGIDRAVSLARSSAPHTMRVEIEVTTLEQLHDALAAGADVVLLDNMAPAEIRSAVETVAGRALVEASGGVTLDNVREIAEAGVDFISVGALTHSAPALDISLEVGAA